MEINHDSGYVIGPALMKPLPLESTLRFTPVQVTTLVVGTVYLNEHNLETHTSLPHLFAIWEESSELSCV